MNDRKVTLLFNGDPRCETLLDALSAVLYERGEGLPVPSILGVLRLLEHDVIQHATE